MRLCFVSAGDLQRKNIMRLLIIKVCESDEKFEKVVGLNKRRRNQRVMGVEMFDKFEKLYKFEKVGRFKKVQ